MIEKAAEAEPEPRIAPLTEEELSDDARELATRLRANFGLTTKKLPDAITTMLRHPELYRAHVDYVSQRTKARVIDPRELEIMVLRTAWLSQCGYTWGEHVKFGKQAGLTSDDVERLTEGSEAPGWNERERAIVRLAEELHETCFVSDETWEKVAANFSDKEIIELLETAGSYREVAYLYNTMRVRRIEGNPGLSAR